LHLGAVTALACSSRCTSLGDDWWRRSHVDPNPLVMVEIAGAPSDCHYMPGGLGSRRYRNAISRSATGSGLFGRRCIRTSDDPHGAGLVYTLVCYARRRCLPLLPSAPQYFAMGLCGNSRRRRFHPGASHWDRPARHDYTRREPNCRDALRSGYSTLRLFCLWSHGRKSLANAT
jgi:hypothetical protein